MGKILSISIAAYNSEKYIKKALDSLIDENIIDDLEIFVVDDGGTDQTLAIAQEYADRYPGSVIPVHKENGGYGSTINTSIELATGKYFKQLDGDDWYLQENLSDLIELLKRTSVDCVLTDYVRYDEITKKSLYKNPYPYLEDGEYLLCDCGLHDRLSMYSSLFRTGLLKNMKGRLTEHCFYTDVEYSALPIPYIESIYVWHKAIYVYRIGEEGQSMNVSGIAAHYKEHELVFWKLFKVYDAIPEDKTVNRRVFEYLLVNRLAEHVRFMCLLPVAQKTKKELVSFVETARHDCPQILETAMKKNKFLRVLIGSHYLLYPPLGKWLRKNWRSE